MDNSNTSASSLHQLSHGLANKKVTLGFDGFIDTVVKVIRHKHPERNTYFDSIAEFGKFTTEKSGKSFSLELEELTTKLGGNMPIMANALARLGTKVSCLGPLGMPAIHPVFKELSTRARTYSFGDPGISTALEFKDGKILLAQMTGLNKIDWSTIKEIVGVDQLTRLFTNQHLIGILNWSELDNSTDMWMGLLEDVLNKTSTKGVKPIGFFDLSDCSRRSEASIGEALELLKTFSNHWRVILSLNLNEATVIYNALTGSSIPENNIQQAGEILMQKLEIDTILIHYSKQALAWTKTGFHKKETLAIQNPMLSTGAGDNFNAGFCAGMLMGIDNPSSLALGHATASHYMRTGGSPTMSDLT